MITFSQLGTLGRLGNQLFQYAILKAVSNAKGYKIVLNKDIYLKSWHGQNCLLKYFKLPSANYGLEEYKSTFFEKGSRVYDDNVFNVEDFTNFHGFFQNVKYYLNIRDLLIQEFEMENEIENKTNIFLNKYTSPTVSLHFRRGDACDGTNPIDDKWSNDFSTGSFVYNYYNKALKLIPENSTIFLFTGGSRFNNSYENDLNWCKEKFKDKRIIFIDSFNDIESFCLMKKCNYNITSLASTYGWWASFLNKNNNIIASKTYYPTIYYNIEDVYPSNWTLI
jgi:hypothetical protein